VVRIPTAVNKVTVMISDSPIADTS
jgi:hypothetical protein